MASVTITCPKCRSPLPAASAGAVCPVCKSSLPGSAADAAPGRRHVVVAILAGVVLVYVAGGIGLAVYVLKSARKPTTAGTQPAASVQQAASLPPQPAHAALPPSPPPRPLVAQAPALTEQEVAVNQAIDRGVQYLQKFLAQNLNTGSQLSYSREGVLALIGFTLLECDVPADDPAIRQIATELRSTAKNLSQTYPVSLAIIFLDRLGDTRDGELIGSLALRLVAAQDPSGAWGYDCPASLRPQDEEELLGTLRNLKDGARGGDKIKVGEDDPDGLPAKLRDLRGGPRRRARGLDGRGGVDHSNTQFALLALWVAQRHGVPVQPSLALVAEHFRRVQNSDGSWGYHAPGQQWRSSMTCSGLLGLAVGRGIEDKLGDGASQRTRDPAIERGFQYLSQTIGKSRSGGRTQPGRSRPIGADAHGDLYYLWSLERVAMVYDLQTIAGKDWYTWAADALVGCQRTDGAWRDNFTEPVDTSFALLVLRRVNVARDLTANIKRTVNLKGLEGAAGERPRGGRD